MKILNRFTNACLWESDHATLLESLVAAVKSGADLRGANLRGANAGMLGREIIEEAIARES